MQLSTLIIASRPKTWIASVAPICIATCYAISEHLFSWPLFLSLLVVLLSLQILANFVNDLSDSLRGGDTQERIGPERACQNNLLSYKNVVTSIIAIALFSLIPMSYILIRGGILLLPLWMLGIAFAFLYSLGNYSFAQLGIGELICGLFLGPFATITAGFLFTNHWSTTLFLWGVSPGLFSSALLLLNNLRDIKQDSLSNRKTIPIRWGFVKGKYIALSLIGIATLSPLILSHSPIHFLPLVFSTLLFKKLCAVQEPIDVVECFFCLGPLFILSTLCSALSILL